MKKLILTAARYLPLAADEEPGMPSFEICGSIDGRPFAGTISMEIEGREADYTPVMGPAEEEVTRPGDNEQDDIFCLVAWTPAWDEAVAEHEARWAAKAG